jgi:predicted nucleotide-binding protein
VSGTRQDFGSNNDVGSGNNFSQTGDNRVTTVAGVTPPAAGAGPASGPAAPAAAPAPAADDHSAPAGEAAPGRPVDKTRNVFVVHGRDDEVRRAMFGLLRSLDLRPMEWERLVRATGGTLPFLGEVIEKAPAEAQAALVLLTPDDVVRLHPDLHGPREHEYELRDAGQPRPNVLIELGMVLMAYPERTIIVEIGAVKPIADIAGRNVIKFDGSDVALGKIAQRLRLAGCAVDEDGSDWRETAPFRDLAAYLREPPSA